MATLVSAGGPRAMEEGRRAKSREAEAAARRDEQLRNFDKSPMMMQRERDKTREPPPPSSSSARSVRFDWRSMFHAACAASDREEARRLLLNSEDPTADVDCLNIDGLSALHQAAIDNNLEMVEFLIDLGADINVEDRESWTPLHATVNCGHDSIARYLIDNGANLAAVNSDGNLPIDIAESEEMKSLLQDAIMKQGIDCDAARKEEERVMTADSIYWAIEAHTLRHPHPSACKIDPETGSTALHVASAKGYMQVMRLLIRCCKVDLNSQDVDGWTPLHAASYWSQKDALELLISSGANIAVKNSKGETYVDLANYDIAEFIKKIEKDPMNRKQARKMLRGPIDVKSKTRDKDSFNKKGKSCGPLCEVVRIDEEIAMLDKAEKWAEDSVQNVNLEAAMPEPDTGRNSLHKAAAKGYMKVMEVLVTKCYLDIDSEDNEGWTPLHFAAFYEQNDAVAYLISWGASPNIKNKKGHLCTDVATAVMKNHISNLIMKMKFRRRMSPNEEEIEIARKRRELKAKFKTYLDNSKIAEKDKNNVSEQSSDMSSDDNTQSKESPEGSEPTKDSEEVCVSAPAEVSKNENLSSEVQTKPHENIMSSDDEVKGKRSFVPPTRDEESATQRKAHAKRIRETRRSTQGISLEEIQNAELLIRKTSNPPAGTNDIANSERVPDDGVSTSVSETVQIPAPTHKPADATEDVCETSCCVAITLPLNNANGTPNTTTDPNTISTTATIATSGSERRPSWRLRLDSGCKFALEHVGKSDSEQGKLSSSSNTLNNNSELSDSITIPLRRMSLNDEKPPMDRVRTHSAKLPDNLVTKNNIRRRSTGIAQMNSQPNDESSKKLVNNEDSTIDYKKLYEKSQLEIERLNKIIKTYEEQFASKGNLDSKLSAQDINEKEKREKRALQRKLSEMEEELRSQKALQTENQRLKDENGALIRVISKLSK